MKDQASLNLLIVDSPIDSKALTGHLMLRATSSGLKVYDATGSETELGGGGEIDWSNVSASTINLSTTTGELKLMGASSMTLELPASNSKIHFEGASLNLFATDLNFNGSALNTAEGLVQLDESGRLPAVDGSQLTNLPAATVDLSNYTTTGSVNITANTSMKLTGGAGMQISSSNLTLGDSGGITKIYGITTIDGRLSLTSTEMSPITINGHDVNTPSGLVMLDENGKIPSSLYDAGTGGDTSALEERVTTLEGTVGTLDAAVDEILADYGEGSGALVYRVVASATEPENPTEGMIWIQTE